MINYELCLAIIDCDFCTANPHCGWCEASYTCFPGNKEYSSCPTACTNGWLYGERSCSNKIKAGKFSNIAPEVYFYIIGLRIHYSRRGLKEILCKDINSSSNYCFYSSFARS